MKNIARVKVSDLETIKVSHDENIALVNTQLTQVMPPEVKKAFEKIKNALTEQRDLVVAELGSRGK